jgi:ferredoxin
LRDSNLDQRSTTRFAALAVERGSAECPGAADAVSRPGNPLYATDPNQHSTLGGSQRDMAYVIAEPCIDVLDISCVSVCPVDCIHYEEGVDRKLFIDPNECIDCGACEPECPVNAIFPEDQVPAEWSNFTPIDALWFNDRAAAREAVDAAKPR